MSVLACLPTYFVCLSLQLSVYIYLPTHVPVYVLSIGLSVNMSVFLIMSTCPPTRLCLRSIHHFILSLCLFFCLSLCLYFLLRISLCIHMHKICCLSVSDRISLHLSYIYVCIFLSAGFPVYHFNAVSVLSCVL